MYCVKMATNLLIDQRLLSQAVRLGKHKTKREAVNVALEQYVRSKKVKGIIDLFGKIDFDAGYDYKKQRRYSTTKGLKKAGG
jgi:hypothetical protein